MGIENAQQGPKMVDQAVMPLDFSEALWHLKDGERCARKGWNGAGQYVALQRPDEYSKMRRPYLYIHPVGGELVPWVASISDLLADDWFVVKGE